MPPPEPTRPAAGGGDETATPIVAASGQEAARHSVRGGIANLLGLLARLVRPVFWIAATRLYGADRVGEFAVAVAFLELARQFTSSGAADAVVFFLSRDIGREDARDRLYDAMASAIWFTLAMGGAVVAWTLLGGHAWVAGITKRALLDEWVPLLVWSVPLQALAETLVAATRAHMVMRWNALILGALQPVLQLVLLVTFALLGFKDHGLAWAWLLGMLGTALAALAVFGRYFDLAGLAGRLARPRWHGEMMRFVWPQNLNMTFNYFANNLDVLMLGMLGAPSAQIAFYNAGIQLTRNLQGIKIAFGASFSPVIARFHADRRTGELNEIFQKLSRLSLIVILPIAVGVGALHTDLLRLFDPSFGREAGFVFPLLVVPVGGCAFGLAATIIVMSGLVGWNLFNSVLAAAANVLFCLWLIPPYGLLGAALATMVAGMVVRAATLAEQRLILGVRVDLRGLSRPLAAAAVCAAGLWAVSPWWAGPVTRVLSVIAATGVYLALVWRFCLAADERAAVAVRLEGVRRFLPRGARA